MTRNTPLFAGLLVAGIIGCLSTGLKAAPLLLAAEDFEFTSNWDLEGHSGSVGHELLRSNGSTQDALTMIEVPQSGSYDIWTHSVDFATNRPATRRYLVLIDGIPVAKESGQHRHDGLRWEKVGSMALDAGPHVVGLRDFRRASARCDAILLAPPGFDPEPMSVAQLRVFRIAPVPMAKSFPAASLPAAPPLLKDLREVATLGTDAVRISFQQGTDAGGQSMVVRQISVKKNDAWQVLPIAPGEESLSYLYSPKAGINLSGYFPSWSSSQPIPLDVAGKHYVASQPRDPFMAGTLVSLRPIAARALTPQKVEVDYAAADGTSAVGTWSLDGQVERLAVVLKAGQAGYYSLVFSPFGSCTPDEVKFVQLPPLFQMQRVPPAPVMVTSSETPQALALVETGSPEKLLTYIAAADPQDLTVAWATPNNATYGFSLLNARHSVQPTAFSPVLGLGGSKAEAAQSVTAHFAALVVPGDWKSGLETASRDLFRVTDYREPENASLTEAALNMIDLLKDAAASGWDAKLKGNYNIEEKGVASQVAPLTFFSASLLTRDVHFYATRTLPSLEFTLSRKQNHYAVQPVPGGMYVKPADVVLQFPGWQGAPTYWRGVYEMTGELNPWIREMALGMDHEPTLGGIPPWTELLGLYELDPTPARLALVEKACDASLATEFYGRQKQPLGINPFYNRSNYPYWWDLLDLYQITQNPKYLDAAQEGAFGTLAGLWSHPMPPAGAMIVNQGGEIPGNGDMIWWKGMTKYRLGFPRHPGDTPEHEVPAWEASPVGLGLEQPCTYVGGVAPDGGLRNIQNSTWAPSLLRIYEMTGRDIYRTYARDTIVGRFANYPGYYLNASTDVMMSADYPYKGPDITSIYYHHIPVHLGFTLDYLFAQVEQLSGGRISFPWTRQQGYVWFNNREFGWGSGNIYADQAMRPWLDRDAFSVDSHQVDYLGALGPGRFDVVLMNATTKPVHANLNLDPEKTGVRLGGSCDWMLAGGAASQVTVASKMPFDLAAQSVAVIRFTTGKVDPLAAPVPSLADQPVELALPAPWGTLHAMRIRSPFGQDSIYAFVTGIPPAGSEASLEVEGSGPVPVVNGPPYEFSIFPIAMDQDVSFHLILKEPQGPPISSSEISLPGTR